MRMTFGEAVKLVLSQFGIGALWVQLGIWIGLVLVTLMGFGSIFLSAWGLEWITATFLVFYLIIVLGVIYSPITWSGISGAAVIAGQPGGEPNLSLNDGITVLKRWAPIALDKMSLVLIFWVPAWFLYTILFSTKGYVQENMFLFVFLPTLIYFAKDEWPTGKLVLRIAGYLLIAIAVYVVGATVFGTVERKVADPSVQAMQEYHDQLKAEGLKLDARVTDDLIALKKTGKPLTAEQKAVWEYLERKRQAQSLRPTDLKGKVEEFVGEANPADKSWWKQYWPLVGGLVIGGIALAVYSRRRLAGGSTAGTAHAAPAGAHAPAKKKGWVGKILFILIAGGLGYLYVTERIGYSKEQFVMIEHLGDQQVCGLPNNTWLTFRVVNPVVVYAGRPGERPSPFTLTDSFRMVRDLEESPKRFAHPGEVFLTNKWGCTAWSFPLDDQGGKVAIDKELTGNRRSVLLHFESVAPWRWHK
jgi:hypothetical protein